MSFMNPLIGFGLRQVFGVGLDKLADTIAERFRDPRNDSPTPSVAPTIRPGTRSPSRSRAIHSSIRCRDSSPRPTLARCATPFIDF